MTGGTGGEEESGGGAENRIEDVKREDVKKEDVKIERQTPIAIWRRCGKIVAADFGPRDSDDIAGGSGLRVEDGKLRIERLCKNMKNYEQL